MPFVRKAIQYFKYLYKPNVTIVGAPTITNEVVVSGFSSANYLTFPVTITSASVTEGQICFTTGSDVTTRQGLFLCIPADNSTSFAIYNGKIYLVNKTYAYDPSFVSLELTVSANTKYYFKFTQSGTSITPSLSTDGVTFTNGQTVSRSQSFGSNIGYGLTDHYVNTPFLGSIDLKNTYIKQDGTVFWEGFITRRSSGSSSDYDFTQEYNKLYNLVRRKRTYYKYGTEPNATVVGSLTVNNGVASGFDASSYLILPEIFDPQSNTWEMVWDVTTGSTPQGILIGQTNSDVYVSGYDLRITSGGYIALFIETTELRSQTLLSGNTKYLIKAQYTGSAYIVSHSADNGESWIEDINQTSSVVGTPDFSVPQYVGWWGYSLNHAPFQGSIDLNNSYIKINGEMWWHGTKVAEATKDDYDYYTDNLVSYTPAVYDEFTYRITHKQTATGTYTITLDKDYEGDLLFVGNGGGGGSSQNDSYWRNSSGGSGACFQGRVRLSKGTYTLTIGTLGYGYNIGNTANMTGGADSTDSYLTDENGNELIRVGCGVRGTVIGTGGAGGTLTLGTLEVLETTKAVNGNQGDAWGPVYGQGQQVFALSAYDGTTTGYGAGTSSYYGGGNVYGVAGIFKLDIEYLDKGLRSY